MRLTILGPPRTKKNSLRRIKRGNRIFTVSSEAHQAWEQSASLQLKATRGWQQANVPVSLRALVYRDRNVGDLGNYLAAICDALERAGVVLNDRLIQSFDGSRLLLDKVNPRVEIDLEAMG